MLLFVFLVGGSHNLKQRLAEFKSEIANMPQKDAEHFRSAYVDKFINTNSEYYKKHIEFKRQFSDGMCYTGYLWDCLINPSVIKIQEIVNFRVVLKNVLVFWDIHSKDRILIPDYWKFGKDHVLKLKFDSLIDNLKYLPEDLYIFDESLEWTIVLTHEDNNGERICIKSGNI